MSLAESKPLLVLIASPLLGPSSWSPLAAELARRGRDCLVSVDAADQPGTRPYWRSTVDGVTHSLRDVAVDRPIVLVGHSGAGALLPAVAASVRQPVQALVLVDAGLPAPARSRLESMGDEGPTGAAFAAELAPILDAGGRYPEWTDADLAPLVPDPERRRQLLAEMRPRGRDFWNEPLPVVEMPRAIPGGYLQFSESYAGAAEAAAALGWPLRNLEAAHFHHLVDERGVADALLELLSDLRSRALAG